MDNESPQSLSDVEAQPKESTQKSVNPLLKSKTAIGIAIFILIATGSIGAYFFTAKQSPKAPVACTQEAKLCPDGSTVTRTGPNCEFTECPIAKLGNGQEEMPKDNGGPIVVRGDLELSCKSNQYPTSPYASIRSGYFKKDSQVYFHDGNKDTIMTDADANTFQCLSAYRGTAEGRFYGKDKDNVYFGTSIIDGADPNVFTLFTWQYYAKDSMHVYADGILLEDADPNTFKFNNSNVGSGIDGNLPARYYAQDKNRVFINQTRLLNSDPATFVDVGSRQYGYSKDKNNVYFSDKIITGADPATFQYLVDGIYFRDKNFVYYKNTIFKNADTGTFTVLSTDQRKISYAYDKSYYYKNNAIIGNRNSQDFRVLNKTYLLNKNHLLWRDKDILINDPLNLEYVAAGYLKDGVSVYSAEMDPIGIIDGVSPNRFKIYSSSKSDYGSDYFVQKGDAITAVYGFYGVNEEKLENVDVDTFQLISWPYAKDKQSVFLVSKKIEGADPLTFKLTSGVLSEQYALDKSSVYFGSKKLEGANPSTFRTREFGGDLLLGIDDKSVYYEAQKLDGINPLEVTVEPDGLIIRDSDTAWYAKSNCHSVWYVPESEIQDPANYVPPC